MSGHLPPDMVDRADRLIYQATGLLDLIGAASLSDQPPADEAYAAAAWLARDLLAEVKTIVNAEVQS